MIYGHSLGGAIAIDLVAKHPDALGMIVDASFTSMSDMAQLDPKYRIFPIDLLIHQRFDSIAKVRSLAVPVLYIHGTADDLIPSVMSQRVSSLGHFAPINILLLIGNTPWPTQMHRWKN